MYCKLLWIKAYAKYVNVKYKTMYAIPFKTFKHKQKNVKLNPKFYKQPVQKL